MEEGAIMPAHAAPGRRAAGKDADASRASLPFPSDLLPPFGKRSCLESPFHFVSPPPSLIRLLHRPFRSRRTYTVCVNN